MKLMYLKENSLETELCHLPGHKMIIFQMKYKFIIIILLQMKQKIKFTVLFATILETVSKLTESSTYKWQVQQLLFNKT